ncbi:hypothetical protein [Williamsia sterculiae]|uniref:EcsC protein family protein n=1 Tax=Williamsia sterculiae TaxID=1344003 RepID=A0A1N7E192_9NOCA|nr:hypothetical protein [Williamsia sterculiae]SIR81902.1 hypothetical protein SAMN05445060_1093 [Williamsia sterculiae]
MSRPPIEKSGEKNAAGWFGNVVDHAQRLQGPAVSTYVRKIRDAHPGESPAQIVARLDSRYLTAVTGSGGAVGATAALPGVGTLAAIAALGGEGAFFVEASALYALALGEVYGIPVHDRERRKTLVLTVLLGDEGLLALGKALGTRTGPLQRLGRGNIPESTLTSLNGTLVRRMVKKFALKRAPAAVGKLMPAGIGAAIGSASNRSLGKRVVANSRDALGPPPAQWPVIDGEVIDSAPPAAK